MKEEYLQFIFNLNYLGNSYKTTDGKQLEVLKTGILNVNSGPDFLESQIKFDDKIWAGNIEFHVKSSDWYKHKHHLDSSYNNVIAHFVYEYDQEVIINDFLVPTIELKSLIDIDHYHHYIKFKNGYLRIPCQNLISKIDQSIVKNQIHKFAIYRLENKVDSVKQLFELYKKDQFKTLISLLAKVFGGTVNNNNFIQLAEIIELRHLASFNFDLFKIESYLFGLAGFLNSDNLDDYGNLLLNEYTYQKKCFGLNNMNKIQWKFSRIRPAGFPTIRLAQFAALLSSYPSFLKLPLHSEKIRLSEYWCNHYNFNKPYSRKQPGLSNDLLGRIIINVVIPFNIATQSYVKVNSSISMDIGINKLKTIKSEQNSILKFWNTIGIKPKNAFESQGLIELDEKQCKEKRCISCNIGAAIFSIENKSN